MEEHDGKNIQWFIIICQIKYQTRKMEMIIGIEKCDDTKILIETDGKLPDDVTVIIK